MTRVGLRALPSIHLSGETNIYYQLSKVMHVKQQNASYAIG